MHSKMKKLILACLTGLLVLGLSGCGNEKKQAQEPAKGPYADLPQVTLVGGDSSGKGSVGQRFGELVAKKWRPRRTAA